ncbi:MAG: zinc-binding dehydrogenase [Clostridia bacterium]
MKSWIIKNTRKMELLTVNDEETPLKNQAKIKIIRAGICSNDIAMWNGTEQQPIIPSKIAVGLVSNSDDDSLKKGQRVMLSPYSKLAKDDSYTKSLDCDGYLSDYAVVDTEFIYPMPDGISDEEITFIDDIALALKAYTKLDVDVADYVLLYGASTTNLIFAQLCRYYQSIPVIIDDDNDRLAKAIELGVDYTINTLEENAEKTIKELTSGKMANFLVVDTDNFQNFTDFLPSLTLNAKVALTTLCHKSNSYKCDLAELLSKNITIYAVKDGEGEISTAINMLATKTVHVTPLINQVVDFDKIVEVFQDLSGRQNCFKTIVKC